MNMQIHSLTRAPRLRHADIAALTAPGEIDIEALRKYVPVLRRKVAAGQYVYRAGQPFQALYLVHVGFLKTSELAGDGREQVTGFRMRGDLVGVESIGLKSYSCDVMRSKTVKSGSCRIRPFSPHASRCRTFRCA